MTALREDPDLASYDVVLVNSSAGKDSQAMLDLVHERAVLAGVQDRVVVVHADVRRAEWDGTAELEEYVRVEREIGHTFKRHLPIAEILEAVDRGELPKGEASFEAGL